MATAPNTRHPNYTTTLPTSVLPHLGFPCPSRVSMSVSFAPSASAGATLFASGHRRLVSRRISSHGIKNGMLRRKLVTQGIALSVFCTLSGANPAQGMDILPFKKEGYSFWTWKGRKIHYVEQGSGPPVVLIHGFGASAFHWRYNIPELAKKYKVYAIDLLGFGWSEKALVEYDATVWRDQVSDFMKEIVGEPAILVGNSLGGFTALFTAADLPQQVIGLVLLNSAGQFGNGSQQPIESEGETPIKKFLVNPVKEIFQKLVLGVLFWQAKQPARIESVLKSVYINKANVDNYLVQSIIKPAGDPNAGEVYYRLMSRFMTNQSKYTLNSLLGKLSCPLLLIWGDLDPWVGPAKAVQIKEFYPNTTVVNLQAGHCPHDEVPELVNEALMEWLSSLKLKGSLQTV